MHRFPRQLECPWMHSFASQDAYFALSATRYSKHAIKPLLGDPQIPDTKTRLWCRQIVREKFLLACWENTSVQINQPTNQPTPPNPDKVGSSRKLCHRHSSRSPDTDKVAPPGKVKQVRDRLLLCLSPSSFHLVPSRQEQEETIETLFTETEHLY